MDDSYFIYIQICLRKTLDSFESQELDLHLQDFTQRIEYLHYSGRTV
jgi:hypothetical protein